MKSTGYKEMLRDRMPRTLNLALKWCKAKEKWLSYVYDNHIKQVPKNMRGNVVKQCLGLKPKWSTSDMHAYLPLRGISHKKIDEFIEKTQASVLRNLLSMDFKDTILWDNLTEEEANEWERINSWVVWFKTQYAYIENTYKISQEAGKDEQTIKVEIIRRYLSQLMPSDTDDETTKEAKFEYVDRLTNYLVDSFKE